MSDPDSTHLAALMETLREVEAERDRLQKAYNGCNRNMIDLEAERDRLAARVAHMEEALIREADKNVVLAARVEGLEAALREISEAQFIGEASNIARDALTPPGEETT